MPISSAARHLARACARGCLSSSSIKSGGSRRPQPIGPLAELRSRLEARFDLGASCEVVAREEAPPPIATSRVDDRIRTGDRLDHNFSSRFSRAHQKQRFAGSFWVHRATRRALMCTDMRRYVVDLGIAKAGLRARRQSASSDCRQETKREGWPTGLEPATASTTSWSTTNCATATARLSIYRSPGCSLIARPVASAASQVLPPAGITCQGRCLGGATEKCRLAGVESTAPLLTERTLKV